MNARSEPMLSYLVLCVGEIVNLDFCEVSDACVAERREMVEQTIQPPVELFRLLSRALHSSRGENQTVQCAMLLACHAA